MANEAGAAQAAPKPKAPSQGLLNGLMPIGSLHHSLLWTEKSGALQALINTTLQFVFPLIGLSLHHIGDWPKAALLLMIALASANGFWYPSAQANAVENVTRNPGGIDAQQANRDLLWSVLPLVPIGISVVLTFVGWGLLAGHMLDGPGWVDTTAREMLIMSWPMLVYNIFVAWAVKADVGNNNSVLAEMAQIAGRLLRYEQSSH